MVWMCEICGNGVDGDAAVLHNCIPRAPRSLQEFADDLAAKQESLGIEFSRILSKVPYAK